MEAGGMDYGGWRHSIFLPRRAGAPQQISFTHIYIYIYIYNSGGSLPQTGPKSIFFNIVRIFRHAIKDEALKIRSSALTQRDRSIRTSWRLRKTCQMLNPTIPSSWP